MQSCRRVNFNSTNRGVVVVRTFHPSADLPSAVARFVQYDHACTLEDREERLGLLANALWRGVYMSNEDVKMPLARMMAEYVDSELNGMYELDTVREASDGGR